MAEIAAALRRAERGARRARRRRRGRAPAADGRAGARGLDRRAEPGAAARGADRRGRAGADRRQPGGAPEAARGAGLAARPRRRLPLSRSPTAIPSRPVPTPTSARSPTCSGRTARWRASSPASSRRSSTRSESPWRWKPEARLSGFRPESAAFFERAAAVGGTRSFPPDGVGPDADRARPARGGDGQPRRRARRRSRPPASRRRWPGRARSRRPASRSPSPPTAARRAPDLGRALGAAALPRRAAAPRPRRRPALPARRAAGQRPAPTWSSPSPARPIRRRRGR